MLKLVSIFVLSISYLYSSIYYIDNDKKMDNVLKTIITKDKNNSEHTFILTENMIDNNKNKIENSVDYQNIKLNLINVKGKLLKQTNLYMYLKNSKWSPAESLKLFEKKLNVNVDKPKIIKKKLITNTKIEEKKIIQLKLHPPIEDKKNINNKKIKDIKDTVISSIIKKIINKNKDYIKENKNKKKIIDTTIKKMKNDNKIKIKNPFKQKNIDLYKYDNKFYTKEELENLIKNKKIKITNKNIQELAITLRSVKNINYKLIKSFYINNEKKLSKNSKLYFLNTLLLVKKDSEIEKKLGLILLNNQDGLDQKEIDISYKILNIF